VHLLRTFCNRWVQPLKQRAIKMWLYPGPSCLDCSFFNELSNAEINTHIHMVLDHGGDLNPGAALPP
jgi:hypothetical protein